MALGAAGGREGKQPPRVLYNRAWNAADGRPPATRSRICGGGRGRMSRRTARRAKVGAASFCAGYFAVRRRLTEAFRRAAGAPTPSGHHLWRPPTSTTQRGQTSDLRSMKVECTDGENELSYVRSLAQGGEASSTTSAIGAPRAHRRRTSSSPCVGSLAGRLAARRGAIRASVTSSPRSATFVGTDRRSDWRLEVGPAT